VSSVLNTTKYNFTIRGLPQRVNCYVYFRKSVLKSPEHSLGIKMGNNLKYPKNLNNCVIKHKLYELCPSFEENCAQTRTFSNTPFNMRGYYFLSMGQKKDLPESSCTFLFFKCCHNIFKSQTFNIAFLHCDSCLSCLFR